MKETSEEADVGAEEEKFCIRSPNDEFQSRQASVFDQLNALEHIHQASVQEWREDEVVPACKDDDDDEISPEINPVSEFNNASRSPFKVPVGLPIKRSAVLQPDFKLHPEKWTKYTLSDVDDGALTSEAANAAAAEDFLRGRSSSWKAADSDYEEAQTTTQDSSDDVTGDQVSFGKFRMPEYVVGTTTKAKVKPQKDKSAAPSSSKGALSFDDKQQNSAEESSVAAVNSSENPAEIVNDSPTFRSIRKRQRNIRKVDTD